MDLLMHQRLLQRVTCWLLVTSALFSTAQSAVSGPADLVALKVADFILSLQDAGGAIRDEPCGKVVNEDSNMEYALLGLAAAYDHSGDKKYLNGLEKGIAWLAEREDMSNTEWRGSWYYTYAASPPYAHKATSPGGRIKDVRGVDATSALFVYLLYLHERVTGSDTFVRLYEANARSALNFVLDSNWSNDGFSLSSWQLKRRGNLQHKRKGKWRGKWKLWRYEYAADQGDVYLGMRAGAILYDEPTHRYRIAADYLQANVNRVFFLTKRGRYGVGRHDLSKPDREMQEFDAAFPQGYLPWVFGYNNENLTAYNWMLKHVRPNGSLKLFSHDPGFSLSAAILALAAQALGEPAPVSSINWLLQGIDPVNGGIHDTADVMDSQYSNVAGFAVLALLGQAAW